MLPFTLAFLIIIFLIVRKPGKFTEGGIALLGLFVLLLLSLLSWEDIPFGLLGNEFLQPFQIIIILISLSVMSTTLDDYGFFKFAAYRAILWSKNNGRILFTNFFILTFVLTSFTSNDVDVLTITPIVLWFALITKINPWPYLFSVFVVANTSSMEFLIGNLTNIIIGTVLNINFLEFFLVMIVPTIITLIAQYFLLFLIFKKDLPQKILNKKELEQTKKILSQPLANRNKNIFVLVILGLVIVLSAVAEYIKIELWLITLIGALVVLLSNEFDIKERFKAFPWNEVVFVLVFMVFTAKLQVLGVVDFVASYFASAIDSLWGAIYISGFLSGLASGIINNIPASISLSSVFYSLTMTSDLIVAKAVAFGLVIGTNLGALVSPVGALATIMWLGLIRKKGYQVPLKQFISYGLLFGFVSIFIACTIVGLELLLISF